MSPSTASLQKMPKEILCTIVTDLNNIDNKRRDSLRSLALVSRELNHCALRELFRTKTVAYRRDVMDSLISVSDSDRLRHCVKHLTIDLSFYDPDLARYGMNCWQDRYHAHYRPDGTLPADSPDVIRLEKMREKLNVYQEGLHYQQLLFKTVLGKGKLIGCLKKLTLVQTVTFAMVSDTATVEQRLVNAEYITDFLSRSTSIEFNDDRQKLEPSKFYPLGFFSVFLEAVSEANLLRQALSHPALGIHTLHLDCALHHMAFRMSPETLRLCKLALGALKKLDLYIDVDVDLGRQSVYAYKTFETRSVYELIECAHGLVDLALGTTFTNKEWITGFRGFNDVMAMWHKRVNIEREAESSRTPALELFVGHKRWHFLENISVKGLLFHEAEFVDFILRHAETLREISCTWCHLLTGSWSQLVSKLAGRLPNVVKFDISDAGDSHLEHYDETLCEAGLSWCSYHDWDGTKHADVKDASQTDGSSNFDTSDEDNVDWESVYDSEEDDD